MPTRIGFSAIEESMVAPAPSGSSSAPLLDESTVTLRCRLGPLDDSSLEALRYARRATLREERTRGVEEDEPSLEDAVFSAHEVVWSVAACCRTRCRAKLDELLARADRVLSELAAARRVGGARQTP